jgi:hypothetical protein
MSSSKIPEILVGMPEFHGSVYFATTVAHHIEYSPARPILASQDAPFRWVRPRRLKR